MLATLNTEETAWLEKFFSYRNELKWSAIENHSAPTPWLENVLPWINAFVESNHQYPIVLPVYGSSAPYQWYGMATEEAGANALAQELIACVGPSYSDFKGYPLQPNLEDQIEQTLVERFGRFVFRLEPVSVEASTDVSEALRMYLGMLRRRPEIPDRTQRPFGKIRNEFDRALLVGNQLQTERLCDELISTGRLDAEMQKYLHIRMLVGLGRQDELAHDDYYLIKTVCGMSLPPQIIADLVEVLYVKFISEIENESNYEVIFEVFKRNIADKFGLLFKERKGIQIPNVLKAFLLFELVQTEPNWERCEAMMFACPEEDRPLVQRWSGHVKPNNSQPLNRLESARQALFDEDYEIALQLSFDAYPESWTFSTLLRCASELEDPEIALKVLAAVDKASETESLNWSKKDISRLHQLRLITGLQSPKNAEQLKRIRPEVGWLSWIQYVESGEFTQHPLDILKDALPRWRIEDYASDQLGCKQLAEKIGNADGEAEKIFWDAFADLVEFFVERPNRPVRTFIPIYSVLISVVACRGLVSQDDLELATDIFRSLLILSPSTAEYEEVATDYMEILQENSSTSNLNWALNSAEILAIHTPNSSETRLRFFMGVLEVVHKNVHRLEPIHYELISLLAKDYRCPNLLENFPVQDAQNDELKEQVDFSGLIGIYTLTEQAGFRARDFLLTRMPRARVEINSDHEATGKLRTLARNADIFVFAWKSSKHQAYFAIKSERSSDQILMPLGKGSASILHIIIHELRNKFSYTRPL